jgi:hypothetical protein
MGWKEGKDIAVTERFLVATQTWWLQTFRLPHNYGDWKSFVRHMRVAIKSFLIAIVMWWLNLDVIQWHQLHLVAIKWKLCILIIANGYVGIFYHHSGIVRWWLILFQPFNGDQFWKRLFEGIWVWKSNPWFTSKHLCSHLGFMSLVALL